MTGGQRACSRCGGGEYEEESFCRMTDAALAGGTAARRDALCGLRPTGQRKQNRLCWGQRKSKSKRQGGEAASPQPEAWRGPKPNQTNASSPFSSTNHCCPTLSPTAHAPDDLPGRGDPLGSPLVWGPQTELLASRGGGSAGRPEEAAGGGRRRRLPEDLRVLVKSPAGEGRRHDRSWPLAPAPGAGGGPPSGPPKGREGPAGKRQWGRGC